MKATAEEVIHFLQVAEKIGTTKVGVEVAVRWIKDTEADMKALLGMLTDVYNDEHLLGVLREDHLKSGMPNWLAVARVRAGLGEGLEG